MEVPAAPLRGIKAAQTETVRRILQTGNGPSKTSCFTQKTIFQEISSSTPEWEDEGWR